MRKPRQILILLAVSAVSITTLVTVLSGKQKWERKFVGAQTCALCHKEQFERWKASLHAHATEVLPAAQRNNKYCLSCHGVALDDGFVGVQCEACHGGGTQYAKRYVMKDKKLAQALGLVPSPDKQTCRKCHTGIMPRIKEFDLDEALKKVRAICKPQDTNEQDTGR